MPDEIRRLGPHAVIVLQQGQPPFILRRLNYLTDPECTGMFDPNPMHAGR